MPVTRLQMGLSSGESLFCRVKRQTAERMMAARAQPTPTTSRQRATQPALNAIATMTAAFTTSDKAPNNSETKDIPIRPAFTTHTGKDWIYPHYHIYTKGVGVRTKDLEHRHDQLTLHNRSNSRIQPIG